MTDPNSGADRLHRRMARGAAFLGSEVAIMAGAMSWVSERNLVAAMSNAGGFGVIACGAMTVELLDREIAATKALTDRPFGVNLITMHPDLLALIAVCGRHARRPCRARRRAAAQGLARGDQGDRRQGDLLRARAQPRQEADPLGRRRAGRRGDGGGRAYRPGLDQRARAGDPARGRRAGAGVRRRRDRPRARRSRAISTWARRASSSARASSARPNRSRIANFKQAFIRASARDAVASVQIDPRLPVIPVRALKNAGGELFTAKQREVAQPPRRGGVAMAEAQLQIEHYWAGALRRAVIDGDVEHGSVMAGQSVGMVTREEPLADILARADGRGGAARWSAARRRS